jgi:hypothetical protein
MIHCIDISYDRGVILITYCSKLLITRRVKSIQILPGMFNKHFREVSSETICRLFIKIGGKP